MVKSAELKVGLLVVLVGAIIAGLTLKVSDGPGLFAKEKTYWFTLDNASGLVPNSAVRMAGIRVGKIDSIQLKNGRAKIIIRISDEAGFTESGSVNIRPQGLLGDKIVELVSGPEGSALLPNGSEIKSAHDKGSIDDVVGEVGAIAGSLGELAKIISDASGGNGDESTPIGRIILNLEAMTKDLSQITAQNKDKIGEMISRLHEMTETLDDVVNDQGEKGFRVAWNKATNSIDRLNDAMENLSEVSRKINSGQGTLGQLINDDEVMVKVNTTMDSVNEFLGDASELETSIGYHAEYLADAGQTKSYLDVKIQPGLDRYYLLQVIADPTGVSSHTTTTTQVDSDPASVEDKTVVDSDALKISLLFAKNFYNFTVKGGVMENSGGVGVDYHMLNRKLKWSLDLYNFDDLIAKTYVKYDVWKGLYVIAGANDLTSSDNVNAFMGAGLLLTNDDLKIFASKVSF